jgi:uncharacterized protein YutE (UPF0331/DUF86 family)
VVDRDALSARLNALEGYLAELRALRRIPREEFLGEPGIHHLAERYLHLACECVLDIAHHLISDLGLRQPESYKDAMKVLVEEEIVERELGARLESWMGFRNVLVHFYLDLDHARSYAALHEDLEDLEALARVAARLL